MVATADPGAMAVLVVDDDPDVREVAVHTFEALGVAVLEARDGRDALRLLSAHSGIGLLFCDVRMPGMSGPELAVEAKRVRPHLRVVFTSGYIGEAPLPDVPFVRKPWKVKDLANLVANDDDPVIDRPRRVVE